MIEPKSSASDGSALWTIPNAMCTARFAGSFALLPIAAAHWPFWFVAVYLVLVTSDLIDGPIARSLHQRSNLGARLDTIADATLNACLLIGVIILCGDRLQNDVALLSSAVASYAISLAFGVWKFRRLLAYHTYIAKLSQWLAMIAAVSLVLDWSIWPLRVAAAMVILGNLESIAITATLTKSQSDVPTLFRISSIKQSHPRKSTGLAWVVGQMLLIAAAAFAGPWWSGAAPIPFARTLSAICFVYAAWTGLSGVRHLKRSLTPLPVPRTTSQLVTTGIYALMRHPLYAAMMAMGLGWAAMWSSLPTLMIAASLTIFLHAKALFEETLLREKFPNYAVYAAQTPRYFPKLHRPTHQP